MEENEFNPEIEDLNLDDYSPLDKELIALVERLNQCSYELGCEEELQFGFTTNGYYTVIELDKEYLWNSEDNSERCIEDTGTEEIYMNLFDFILNKIKEKANMYNKFYDTLEKFKQGKK